MPLHKLWTLFKYSHIDRYQESFIDHADSVAIHRVLLERCARVHENDNDYTDFEIRKIGAKLYVYADNRRDFSRFDTADTALDMSAAYAFWAWELRQREKEAGV